MRESQNQFGDSIDSLEHGYSNFWQHTLGVTIIPVPNTIPLEEVSFKNIDLIILSGGGSVPNCFLTNLQKKRLEQPNRDLLESFLFEQAISNDVPILGVCRGMQYINCLLGGKVSDLLDTHIPAVDHEIITADSIRYKVNSFHNDGVFMRDLSNDLNPIAVDKENQNLVEAYKHKSAKILGVQWHPERNFSNKEGRSYTISLLKEFIKNK